MRVWDCSTAASEFLESVYQPIHAAFFVFLPPTSPLYCCLPPVSSSITSLEVNSVLYLYDHKRGWDLGRALVTVFVHVRFGVHVCFGVHVLFVLRLKVSVLSFVHCEPGWYCRWNKVSSCFAEEEGETLHMTLASGSDRLAWLVPGAIVLWDSDDCSVNSPVEWKTNIAVALVEIPQAGIKAWIVFFF